MVSKHVRIDELIERMFNHLKELEAAYLVGDFAKGMDNGSIEVVLIGDLDFNDLDRLINRAKEEFGGHVKISICDNFASFRALGHENVLKLRGLSAGYSYIATRKVRNIRIGNVCDNFIILEKKIAVIGLGYVGLPLAVEFAKYYPTIRLDIDCTRVDELFRGYDRTLEVEDEDLKTVLASNLISTKENENGLYFTTVVEDIASSNIYRIEHPLIYG